ncbi:nuclease-related domain-containing protein [Virgibacillus doumboii]|uniref:nuclease-related domain-containing protein n=1 Tax=Virgibacillus doumboii TaxID=2697503 RepID=UPI0013DF3D7D|nr:nuclease-related domain-containing protein [Virgibacillus doumboii]
MLYKPRTKSTELRILELLNTRMKLTDKDRGHYIRLKKGYEGEVQFDNLTEKLQCECLILNDLLLEVNSTTFQIDSLMIFQRLIRFYEVKNLEGDYYCESDKIYRKPRKEIINPLHQLSRSESLLRQLFSSLGTNPSIESSVVFINPKFTLYQAPLDKPIIFPTQIERHMNQLNSQTSKLTNKHKNLADQLIALNIKDSPFKQLPPYDYDQLRKGITCPKCHSFSVTVDSRKCVCQYCGHAELVGDAVMRSVEEFKILFPDEKITTNVIYDWCSVIASKERIRYILLNNFTRVGSGRWSYFE